MPLGVWSGPLAQNATVRTTMTAIDIDQVERTFTLQRADFEDVAGWASMTEAAAAAAAAGVRPQAYSSLLRGFDPVRAGLLVEMFIVATLRILAADWNVVRMAAERLAGSPGVDIQFQDGNGDVTFVDIKYSVADGDGVCSLKATIHADVDEGIALFLNRARTRFALIQIPAKGSTSSICQFKAGMRLDLRVDCACLVHGSILGDLKDAAGRYTYPNVGVYFCRRYTPLPN